jgi:hypothetical protein
MAIQGSGQIKLTELATEFGGTAPYSLKAYYRGGGRVPTNNTNVPASGAIGLKNFYNAVNRVTLTQTYSTNTTQTTLNVSALAGYVAGIADVTVYVSSNVYVYSTSTASPALAISGATAGDTITLINNGFIIGMGGAGTRSTGGAAGPALSLGYNVSITNNSYIAGGGGGGGSGGILNSSGGGGAGGGGGINASAGTTIVGGAPGSVGNQGDLVANVIGGPEPGGRFGGSGASGGRILPGTSGAGGPGGFGGANNRGGAGGAGGGGGGYFSYGLFGEGTGNGGAGGSSNNAGSNASGSAGAGGGGGGWGAAGGTSGGAGGKAIALNGYAVTYITTGTLYGAVS